MADQHNLTPVLARCMDRHLVFPLLEFLSQKALFDGADIQRAKIDLLQKTNMVDYAMDIYKELYGREAPAEMRERRGEVVAKLKTLQARPPALTLAAGGLSVVGCQRQCAVRAPRPQTSAPTVAALARLRACETARARALRAGPGGVDRGLPQQRGPREAAEAGQGVQPRLPAGGVPDRAGADRRAVPLRQVPVRLRQLLGRGRVPVPLPVRPPARRAPARPLQARCARAGPPGAGLPACRHRASRAVLRAEAPGAI